MPNVFVLPVIRREDYAAFRRDVGTTLPSTHEEWIGLFAKEVAAARSEGKTVIETVVNYGDFVRYCHANGYRPDAMTLLDFAKIQKPLGEA
jgi:hypothetical protein